METRSYRLKDNRKKEKRLSYNLNMLHPRKLLFRHWHSVALDPALPQERLTSDYDRET